MTAVSVSDFANSIGVNTHLDFLSQAYGNTALVLSEVAYLGIKNLRDAMASPLDPALFAQFAAASGVKFDVYLGSGLPYAIQISQIANNLGFIRFAEGINESDTFTQSYKGLSGFAATAAVQKDLYAAVKAAGNTMVIAPSYGVISNYYVAPDSSATSDYGNIHEYFGTGNPPGAGIPALLTLARIPVGNAPILATEAGYYTGAIVSTNSAQFAASVVDETVQAKYDLTILFDNWNLGVDVTYLYDLMDGVADPGNTDFRYHYALFNNDGSPKLAATAIHNLMAILGDTGTPRSGDTLTYQTTGWPSTGSSLLMEKSLGVFDLALWNDIRLWSAVSPVPINNPLPPIVVNFGQIVLSVVEYDPMTGTSPVATWSNVTSFSVGLPDHPVIFEVTLYAPGQLSLASYVLPASLAAGQSSGNLWSQILANVVESNPNWLAGVTINSVQTSDTTGTVSFNAATHSLTYVAAPYNPFNPNDSFTYTVIDGQGGSATGTLAITELPAPNTIYAMTAGSSYTAAATGWNLISLAAGQTFNGNAAGGVSFLVNTDTKVYAGGSNNSIEGGSGNFYAGAGADNAAISLGDGNNTISVTGIGAVITTGNGNNVVWKPSGYSSITMGNGNQKITAVGTNNTVSIGSGVSSISLGTDGSAAGYESVTVAGGTNTITVGGANDTVHVLGGSGNTVVSTGGLATIIIEGGSNTLNVQVAANIVILNAGVNVANANGAGNSIYGGSGNDTIWAGGDNNSIVAGSGTETITFAGHNNIIDVTRGVDTLIENGSGNTIILAAPGGVAAQIKGNVVVAGDIFDLRVAIAATTWSGYLSDLPDYLLVRSVGATSTISIDADGAATGLLRDIAVLNNSANLTYAGLLASAILPPIKAHQLELTQTTMGVSLSGGASSGNLWSMLMANAVEANPLWAAGVKVSSVQTTGTAGTVTFNAMAKTLVYVAPAYNPFNPSDSFSYSVSDGHGGSATGILAVTELPAPMTLYAITAGATYAAPATGWTLISLAAGETLNGNAAGGVSFVVNGDTKVYAGGSNNSIQGGAGNFYAGAGVNNARINLGNGNNTISVTGTGAVISTGNGNNVVWKPSGYATITMGNGNQQITAVGSNNTVSIGSGTSTISLGADGSAAGYETVTVAGGTNTITVGGANDTVHVLGGTGNSVVSTGGLAAITVEAGSNTLNIQGATNTVVLNGGVNVANASGAGNFLYGGSGSDTIWAGGNNNRIVAGTGTQVITLAGQNNIVDLTKGVDTFTENGSGNTIILAASGGVAAQIKGNVVGASDILDLRVALAATTWSGYLSDLPNYLLVRNVGAASIISIDADGTAAGVLRDVAVLANSANLTYAGLLASAILPPIKVHQLELTQTTLGMSLPGGGTSGNLWSLLIANSVEANPSWVSSVTISTVQTTGTAGTVTFNAATRSLIYVAPAYNAFNPSDSFGYAMSDGHGGNVTGSIAITELPAPKTSYAITAAASYTAAATGWTLISLATGQSLNGVAAGGVTFLANIDTKIYASGSNNTIQAGAGNFYAGGGVDNAHISLGDGNNTISVSGVGAVITTGNGNNVVWKPTGYSTITMGDGNQKITATGAGNTVTIGSGTSTLNIGNDGAAAGNESVTVAGGTNTISTGGANNTIHLLGGTGNTVTSVGGQALITVEGGSNTLSVQGAGNTVRLNGGVNTVNAGGDGNTIQGGGGNDRIWAGGNNNLIVAGGGVDTITFAGQHNTIDVTKGAATLIENGSGNTIILAGPGGNVTQISGNVIAKGDIFDLRVTLAATNWTGTIADLPNYLAVRSAGAASIISIDADGVASGFARDVAVLSNSANLAYSGLISTALLH